MELYKLNLTTTFASVQNAVTIYKNPTDLRLTYTLQIPHPYACTHLSVIYKVAVWSRL